MTALMADAAQAAEDLTIMSDRSTSVMLEEAPGTIVIGNPSIADATMEGRRLLLHGKAFGATNIILLNSEGKEIAEYTVRVTADDAESVVVFKQSGKDTLRETYSCAPNCEPTLQVGDSPAFTSRVHANITLRSSAVDAQLRDDGQVEVSLGGTLQ